MILSILINAVIIIAVFSILVLVHELGHFLAAKLIGVRVERFAIGFWKKIFSIKKGGTEYAINILPLGGYCKMAGEDPSEIRGKEDEFYSKPVGKRFWVIFTGPLFNYIFAFLVLVVLYLSGTPTLTSEIGGVLKNSPAEKSGIKAGDKITAINKKPVKYWEEVIKLIREDKEGLPLAVSIDRAGKFSEINVTPSVISAENIFKQKSTFVGLGIAPSEKVEILKSNPSKSVELAARHVWFFTATTYKGIWLLATGAMPVKENVGGPIRIIEVLSNAIKYGPLSVLSIMATISLALAVFNLLPFPILDGGHILFLAIEKIRKKPLSVKTQEAISQVALFLLIAFVVYVSYFDTVRVIMNLKK